MHTSTAPDAAGLHAELEDMPVFHGKIRNPFRSIFGKRAFETSWTHRNLQSEWCAMHMRTIPPPALMC